jgi:site-specific DNA recombinase
MLIPMNLDAYIRVSQTRGREGDSFLSPDQQRERIEGWAGAHGHEIRWNEPELDQSGGKMSRPIFDQVMARIDAGQTQGVVVAKADRFARSLVGALSSLERIEDAGAHFASVAENFDTTTPTGRLVMRVMFSFAEFELDRIKEQWSDAVSDAVVSRGIQPTVAPFGYRKDETRRFVPDPDEAPFVREIFRRRIAGQTWASIARWLNDEDVKPRQSAQWTGSTVKQLTRREVYTGLASKGKHRNENAHEPLVSRADFVVVREVFAKAGDAPSGTRHTLNGMIRCSGCSRLMSGRGYKQKGQPRVTQYQCAVSHTAGTCPAPANVNESVILPYVERVFFDRVGDVSAESRIESVELTQALENQSAAEAALVEYRDDLSLQTLLGLDSFKDGLEARQRALVDASGDVERAKQLASGVDLPSIEHLARVWPDLSAAERQRLLASALDVVYVRRGRGNVEDRVRVIWRGENGHELSGPGRSVPIRAFDW